MFMLGSFYTLILRQLRPTSLCAMFAIFAPASLRRALSLRGGNFMSLQI